MTARGVASLLALGLCAGCGAVAATGAVVGGAVSATGSVVGGAVSAAGSVAGAAVDAATPDDDDD